MAGTVGPRIPRFAGFRHRLPAATGQCPVSSLGTASGTSGLRSPKARDGQDRVGVARTSDPFSPVRDSLAAHSAGEYHARSRMELAGESEMIIGEMGRALEGSRGSGGSGNSPTYISHPERNMTSVLNWLLR
jgi:hypothetical protein